MQEDHRLEHLFDYTKWHIGIYLSIGGGTVALLAADKNDWVLSFLIGNKILLSASLFFMVVAGIAGGIIASSLTTCKTFEDFWDERQGPVEWKLLRGRYWPKIEHLSFWLSLGLLGAGVLLHPPKLAASAKAATTSSAASANASTSSAPGTRSQ